MIGTTIAAFGHYVPERRVTSAELEERLGLEPGWIRERTGIVERRYAAEGERLSDMAAAAGRMALERCDGVEDIGLLILATSTPDHLLPPTAPLVAHRLGLGAVGAIDVAGACAGFIYALTFADAFVKSHDRAALVIAANILSRRLDPLDAATVSLFGDAAGAVVVIPARATDARAIDGRGGSGVSGVVGAHVASDGAAHSLIRIPAGGSERPFGPSVDLADTRMVIADGRAVFSRAVHMMTNCSLRALSAAELAVADVDHWVPHQANARIVARTREKLGLDEGKTLVSVGLYGNSSAATIPLTLSLAQCETEPERGPRLSRGDCLLLSAAGAGLTGGAVVYRL